MEKTNSEYEKKSASSADIRIRKYQYNTIQYNTIPISISPLTPHVTSGDITSATHQSSAATAAL